MVPRPDRQFSLVEAAVFHHVDAEPDRVKLVAPLSDEYPVRYRLSLIARMLGNLSVEIFSKDGDEGTVFDGLCLQGLPIEVLLGRKQTAAVWSEPDGKLVGTDWIWGVGGEKFQIPESRHNIITRAHLHLTVARMVCTATQAPLPRDAFSQPESK